MSIVKRNNNWGYLPDYSGQNYTQRFQRQSRITGTYSTYRQARSVPKWDVIAVVLGALMLIVFMFV